MPTVLKNDIHTNIAQIVYNGILTRTSKAFFFLGKTLPWDNDDVPDTPDASRAYELETRSNIIGMKNVTISDVSFAIDRLDWTSGTVYDMYDDRYSNDFVAPSGATDIADASIFVMTDDFNIYKCISNNYNSVSTVKPTGTEAVGYVGPLADGYVWKYMATVDDIQRSKFLTPEYLPVTNSTTSTYQSGIDANPILQSGGSNYSADNIHVAVLGDGVGAQLSPVVVNGEVTQLIVDDPGTGYTYAEVVITVPEPLPANGADGDGAEFLLQIDQGDLVTSTVSSSAVPGEISFISVESGGGGYTAENTSISISGNGDGTAEAIPVITNGVIVGVTITNRGEGYTQATATVTSSTGTGAELVVIVSPVEGHGYDLVKESFADILAFHSSTLDETNQGFLLENDYRQTGLLFNPTTYVSGGEARTRFNGDYGSTCFRVNVATADVYDSGLVLDQKVYNTITGDEFAIVAIEDWEVESVNVGTSYLLANTTGATPEVGDIFEDDAETNVFEITTSVSAEPVINPTVDKYSGSMVFINNRTSFRKNIEQIVKLRTFVKF